MKRQNRPLAARAALLVISLVLLCVSCAPRPMAASAGTPEPTPTATPAPTPAPTATPEPTPKPTATPVPLLVPTKVITDSARIYKMYDNGEYGYIGARSLDDDFKWDQDSYNERRIRLDSIEAGIPIILDKWTYDYYKQSGYRPKYEYVVENEFDQADYDSKYSEKLKEIQSRHETKKIGKVLSVIDFQRETNGDAYLVDTALQKGIVLARSTYIDKKLNDVLVHFAVNPFEGNRIIDIAINDSHVYGVTEDGRVLSYLLPRDSEKDSGLTDPLEWTDIIDVAADDYDIIALKKDGTVVASGDYADKYDVSDWRDIVAVEVGWLNWFGLKSDGTVVSARDRGYVTFDLSSWTDIVQIQAAGDMLAGLKKDGTVMVTSDEDYDGYGYKYKWDTSRGALFEDIVSIDIASRRGSGDCTLVALNSKGEIFYASIFDYFMDYDEFQSGIDDIAAVSNSSFAVLKGEDIICPSTNVKGSTWYQILKNQTQFKPKPVDYYNPDPTVASIDKDGALVVKTAFIGEGVFTYSSKISKFFMLNDYGTKFLLLAENGDAVYVEADYDRNDRNALVFQSEVLFDHIAENASITKIYTNTKLLVYLDDDGVLHYPQLLQEALTETLYIDWDTKTNWYRDTVYPPA